MSSSKRLNRIQAQLQPNKCNGLTSKVGVKSPNDVVVVSALRTPIGKARRGSFKDTTPDTLLTAVLKATVEKTGITHKDVEDIVVGNVQLGGAYSGPARIAMLVAGYPVDVPIMAVNRQCSSGLQAIANVAQNIASGSISAGIGAGVESMTHGGRPGEGPPPPINMDTLADTELARDCLTPMGITSENVAEKFGITREEQDQLSSLSHEKALEAQKNGYFNNEIIPVTVNYVDKKTEEEKEITVTKDDGPRPGSTVEKLGKLRAVFKPDGSTTAGNSSQVSDGAAAVLLMTREKAAKLGLPVLGVFRGFKVVGVDPKIMGIGPAEAIPAVLKLAGVGVDDVDIYEINEAFASQAVYCIKKLGIPMEKVNPNGGAISLGHPLGMTGARMTATLLHAMQRKKKKLGVVSMCIGTGMGAAALFERED